LTDSDKKLRVLVVCSQAARGLVDRILSGFHGSAAGHGPVELIPWYGNFVKRTRPIFSELVERIPRHDGVIAFLTEHDEAESDGDHNPRENIYFELGLAIGSLGADHALVVPVGGVEIASDLGGVLAPGLSAELTDHEISMFAAQVRTHFAEASERELPPDVRLINRPLSHSYNAELYDYLARLLTDSRTKHCLFSGEGFDMARPGAAEQAEKLIRGLETALDNGATIVRVHTGGRTNRDYAARLADLARKAGPSFQNRLLRRGLHNGSDLILINPDSAEWNVSGLLFATSSSEDGSSGNLVGGAVFFHGNISMAQDFRARFDAMIADAERIEPDAIEEQLAGEVLYFAYGPDMIRDRLLRRCPGAIVQTRAYLDGHRLVFAHTGSGRRGGTATVVEDPAARTWGVVWRLPRMDAAGLDDHEDRAVYEAVETSVTSEDGTPVSCRMYVASTPSPQQLPDDRLLGSLLMGALEAGLPNDWVRELRHQETLEDRDS